MHFDFLMCSERSGSNLIAKIMNAHEDICGPFPSHMLRTFCNNYYRYGDLTVDSNWETLVSDVADYMGGIFANWKSTVTEEILKGRAKERTLAALYRVVYEYEAEAQGKNRLFVKENHAYTIAAYVLSHFPEPKYVHLVRDARDMATHWKRLASGGVQTAAEIWKDDQAGSIKVISYLRDLGRGLQVRFEDLITEPEVQTQRVCDFLGITYSPSMLEFHKDPLVVANSSKMVSWEDLQKPINPDNQRIYRDGPSEAEVRYVELFCADEMEYFGYEPEYEPTKSIEELLPELPDEASTDREQTDVEIAAYKKHRANMRTVESRTLHLS
jgi:hypothetical protein